MKIYTTFAFLLFSLTSFAQFWGVGTQWTYTDYPFTIGDITLKTMTLTEDTIIDNRTVYKLDGTCGCHFLPEYLSEEGEKMYYFYKGAFHLLYDFSLVAGDTLRISTTSVPEWMLVGIDTLLFAIDSVSSLPFNGEDLIVQHTRSVGGIDSIGNYTFGLGYSDFNSPWIEHIGAKNCLFPMGLCEEVDELRCFQTPSGETLNFTIAESCLLNPTNDLENLKLKIYPNPITESFQIENPEGNSYDLRIYDLNGRLIHQQLKERSANQTYDLVNQPPGMYIVEINQEGKKGYQKIIKPR